MCRLAKDLSREMQRSGFPQPLSYSVRKARRPYMISSMGAVAVSASRGRSVGGCGARGSRVDEVVGHLRVQLLGGLLGRPRAAAAANLLVASSGDRPLGTISSAALVGRGGLGLSLGLADALAERLGLRNQVGRSNDDLDL